MRDFAHDHVGCPPDRPKEQEGQGEIHGAIEPMREPSVVEKAEDIDVPLIGVREAVEQDNKERDAMKHPKDCAA